MAAWRMAAAASGYLASALEMKKENGLRKNGNGVMWRIIINDRNVIININS
jgi:hypothetical protein